MKQREKRTMSPVLVQFVSLSTKVAKLLNSHEWFLRYHLHKRFVIAGIGMNILHRKFIMHKTSECNSMPESTFGVGCSGNYGDVCNMADTGQSLATETVRCHGSEVVKGTYLARRKSLTNDLHIFSLQHASSNGHWWK